MTPNRSPLLPPRPIEHASSLVLQSLEEQVCRAGVKPVVQLHQGRTRSSIDLPCNWQPACQPGLADHEHAPPGGLPKLLDAVAAKLAGQFQSRVPWGSVVIVYGATQGLRLALDALIEPGDEVLILSPQWLFARGLVLAAGGKPVEVPVFRQLAEDPCFDMVAAVAACLTGRTRAIYFNTPNNPTGVSLTRGALGRLIDLASAHQIWILADNAYENYDYTKQGFLDIASLPGACECTFSVYTFSKTYGVPGYRIGYLLAPPQAAARARHLSLYSTYSVSTASQRIALRCLEIPATWLLENRQRARARRDRALERIRIPLATRPDGGIYILLDLSAWGDEGSERFVAAAVREGVSVVPGSAFGAANRGTARLCFTSTTVEELELGIERLNRVYAEGLDSSPPARSG